MADFRKMLPALAVLALTALSSVPAAAQTEAFACATTAVPPQVRAEGHSELVGDIVLNCSKGTDTPDLAVTATVSVIFTTNTTNLAGDTPLLFINDQTGTSYAGIVGPGAGGTTSSITWTNVPILASGSNRSVIRITNVRADAAAVAASAPTGTTVPTQIFGYLAITGSTAVPISPSQATVAYVLPGIVVQGVDSVAYRQCESGGEDFTITALEGFPSAFKPRGSRTISVPGAVYNDEGGFMTGAPGVGTATRGTPIRVVFTNIPAGASVVVPNSITTTTTGTDTTPVTVTLVSPTVASEGSTTLTATGTTAFAVYEVMNFNPGATTLSITGHLTYTAGSATALTPPAMQVAVGFDPGLATDVPRFVFNGVANDVATINACVTNLLFPFVTTAAGFDTGIAIANTGVSVDGLTVTGAGQEGACTLYMFGSGAPTTAPVTGTIAAGTVSAWSVYSGTGSVPAIQDFSGYMIARCAFQYGHGYAFISDLGAQNLAQGYLALVIPDLGGNRFANPSSSSGANSGEQLVP